MTDDQLNAQARLVRLEELIAAGEDIPDDMAAEVITTLAKLVAIPGGEASRKALRESAEVVRRLDEIKRYTDGAKRMMQEWSQMVPRSAVATARCPCGRIFTWERVDVGRCPECGRTAAEALVREPSQVRGEPMAGMAQPPGSGGGAVLVGRGGGGGGSARPMRDPWPEGSTFMGQRVVSIDRDVVTDSYRIVTEDVSGDRHGWTADAADLWGPSTRRRPAPELELYVGLYGNATRNERRS